MFLSIRHFFVCFCIYGSLSICRSNFPFSLFDCLFVFLCVCYFVYLTVRISVRVSFHSSFCLFVYFCPSVILSVCVCFCVRVTFCAICQCIFPFFNLSVCLSVCLLSVCFCVSDSPSTCQCFFPLFWLAACVCITQLYYIIYLLIEDNHFHSVTYIDFHVSYKLFRIQSVNLSIILWPLLSCLRLFVRVVLSPMSRLRYILMVV